jgi:hypothetical protein
VNEKNTTTHTIEQMESNAAGSSDATPKPKKRPRVSQRKELAVVTVGMVAAIASFGGLLAGNQAQASPPADTTSAAQVWSQTPGSQPYSEHSSKGQAPAYSSATPGASGKASHAQSQGS